MSETRPRRRDEQAIADRIGRLFTASMPLPLLMALVAEEQREPGKIWKLLEEHHSASVKHVGEIFWANFWREFRAAQVARHGEPR